MLEKFKVTTDYHEGDWRKAPNLISYARGLLCWLPGLVFAIVWAQPAFWWVAIVVMIAVAFTDFADGFVARRYKLITGLGKFLDPLLDKILIVVTMLFICTVYTIQVWWGWWLWIITAVIVLREVIVTLQIRTRGKLVQARMSGKIKMWAQSFMVGGLMIPATVWWWTGSQWILIAFALIMTIVSWVDYWWNFVKKVPPPQTEAEVT